MKKVTVIGSGSWGTALAIVLSDKNFEVSIHSRNTDTVNEINNNSTNEKYLPGIRLPHNIKATSSYEEAMKDSNLALVVVPSHALRQTAKEITPFLHSNMTIVHATKGIENETWLTMSQVLEDELPTDIASQIVVLSGPSHAEEVARRIPTTIVASSKNVDAAKYVQSTFNNSYFRVYTNLDVLGVEIGGALKNIIALGAGISDGLGYGDNAKAALLTRGLAEITRLGVKLGARESTFSGLTGIGDLIVTGTSQHSRNWKTGHLLAQGFTLDQALVKVGMVAEGVKSTKSAYYLAQKYNVDTPITNELYKILFENKNPRMATNDLMTRIYKDET